MTKTKKIILIVVASLLIAGILATTLTFTIQIPIKYDESLIVKQATRIKVEEINGTKTLTKINADGTPSDQPFKIVAFTDMHVDTYTKKGKVTIEMMIRNILDTEPDLVVMVGDNITSANNLKRAKQLGEIFEKLNVYWAPIFGNHEGDNIRSISREKMASVFSSYSHCLMDGNKATLSDGTEIFGWGNYQLNINNADGKIIKSLIFMDGGQYLSKEDEKKFGVEDEYDYLKESQIKWYEERIKSLPEGTKSIVFDHIALCEFETAYNEIKESGEEVGKVLEDGTVLESGKNREGVCCSVYNSGMFDKILELGSTEAFVVGHDHINDSTVLYKGVNLIYNRCSGYSSYNVVTKHKEDTLIQGCSIYEISKEGNLTFDTRINANYYDQTEALALYE